MVKLSKTVLAAGLVALAVPAAPALALQDELAAEPEGLSPEKQSAMMTWPEDTKAFYSSLSAEQQQVFWALSDEDKVTLSRMEPAQRDDIMRQLQARLDGSPAEGR
ncbi:MAG: hypothetical protein ACK4IB_09410 [Erythrobacter sp.]|jgi:hypothetical protein